MEQIIDWLNENELRAYPFLEDSRRTVTIANQSWQIPDNLILDLQLTASAFNLQQPDGKTNPIALKTIIHTYTSHLNGDTRVLEFVFGSSSATLTSFIITDFVNVAYPLYIRNTDGNLIVLGQGLSALIAELGASSAQISTELFVEPSVCLQFNDAWLGVSTLSAIPEKQSKSLVAYGAAHTYEPILPLVSIGQPTKLTGDVKLLEGYNFRVAINNGLIDLEIGTNYGLKMNCSTSFLSSEYLDCSELVSYINGIPPDASGNFKINAGTNIDIVPGTTLNAFNDPLTEAANSHTLFIGLTFQTTDLCSPVNITPTI